MLLGGHGQVGVPNNSHNKELVRDRSYRNQLVNNLIHNLTEFYYRVASSGLVHKLLLRREYIATQEFAPRDPLHLELVSHCWNYSHLLSYQLSSLVLNPPTRLAVTMTVYYCSEDERTSKLLRFFSNQSVANVRWDFRDCSKQQLFRRAIGRNDAALKTTSDWIWFTDCDQVFGSGCLDSLASILPQHQGPLLFPRKVACTDLLASDHEMLFQSDDTPAIVDIDPSHFVAKSHTKAIGALQIVRGDAARAVGYCNSVKHFQQPAHRWKKTYEDRTFRRLIGSQGEPIEVPNIYRIEHVVKGRKITSEKAA